MKYTETHEWIELDNDNGAGVVGVTMFAQKELGDIVYVELPKIGKQVKKGDEVAVLESTKAAADVYSPVSGTIVAVNVALNDHPELVNKSPEQEGWLFKLSLDRVGEMDTLLDRNSYSSKLHP